MDTRGETHDSGFLDAPASRLALHSTVWSGIAATLVMSGMLLAFHQVVSGAVQQSELRRQADATQAEASWLCNAMQGPLARDKCRLELSAPRVGHAMIQAQNGVAGGQPR